MQYITTSIPIFSIHPNCHIYSPQPPLHNQVQDQMFYLVVMTVSSRSVKSSSLTFLCIVWHWHFCIAVFSTLFDRIFLNLGFLVLSVKVRLHIPSKKSTSLIPSQRTVSEVYNILPPLVYDINFPLQSGCFGFLHCIQSCDFCFVINILSEEKFSDQANTLFLIKAWLPKLTYIHDSYLQFYHGGCKITLCQCQVSSHINQALGMPPQERPLLAFSSTESFIHLFISSMDPWILFSQCL